MISVKEFVLDWEELKNHQRRDNKLIEVICRVDKSEGPKDFKIGEDEGPCITKIEG